MDADCPVLAPQVAIQMVEGQAVMVLADSGEVIVLNGVGTRIVELMDGNRDLGEIAAAIESEYDVSSAEARGDLDAFLQTLTEAGALILSKSSDPGSASDS